jgi:hypothetical protein
MIIIYYQDDDETVKFISQLDPRLPIRYLKNDDPKIFLGPLRNRVVRESKGEYIMVWDDDDVHHPKRMEHQMKAIEINNAQVSFLKKIIMLDGRNGDIYLSWERPWEQTMLAHKSVLLDIPYFEKYHGNEDSNVTDILNEKRCVHVNIPKLYGYVLSRFKLKGKGYCHSKVMLSKSLKINHSCLKTYLYMGNGAIFNMQNLTINNKYYNLIFKHDRKYTKYSIINPSLAWNNNDIVMVVRIKTNNDIKSSCKKQQLFDDRCYQTDVEGLDEYFNMLSNYNPSNMKSGIIMFNLILTRNNVNISDTSIVNPFITPNNVNISDTSIVNPFITPNNVNISDTSI